MNKYITRYCNNNKEYCTNLPPTRRRYSTIIVKILRPLKTSAIQNIRFIDNGILANLTSLKIKKVMDQKSFGKYGP